MARVTLQGDCVSFKCPGCGDQHTVPVPPHPRAWQWNGSVDTPTLHPSLSVKSGHYVSGHKKGDPCWCGTEYGFNCYICHSFIKDGRIQFLGDCTHALAGKTVNLTEITKE